jgi:hypothetical protein
MAKNQSGTKQFQKNNNFFIKWCYKTRIKQSYGKSSIKNNNQKTNYEN